MSAAAPQTPIDLDAQFARLSDTANKIADQRNDLLKAMKSLLPQLLPDALAKDKGGLTPESRQRCMAIVKAAIAKAEGR